MNDESGGMSGETLLLVACVVGVFVAALFFALRSNNKRANMMQDFARTRGWDYQRGDSQNLAAKIDTYFPDETFHLSNLMTIETGERNVTFFDCGYHYRERRRGDSFGTGCLIESKRFRTVGGSLEIVARNWLNAAMLPDQVEMGEGAFSRHYIVTTKDAAEAASIVSKTMQDTLVTHQQSPLFNPVRIGINANGAVLLTGLNAEPERWQDLVELAGKIEAGLP